MAGQRVSESASQQVCESASQQVSEGGHLMCGEEVC